VKFVRFRAICMAFALFKTLQRSNLITFDHSWGFRQF
jgi:hypothetical protein